MTAAEFAKLVRGARRRADGQWWDGRCSAHGDRRASLSFCGDSEGKRSSSSLRAISIASEEIWLGSLPGLICDSSSFQPSWLVFSSLA